METNKRITILSTFAKDKLTNKIDSTVRLQGGGPALYLKQVIEKEKTPFSLKTGSEMNVEILITKNGESGKVLKKTEPQKIPFSRIKTPFLLISSVLDEFDLTNLSTFKGKVFLDIQGYVRGGKNFGQKKSWKPSKKIFDNIFCLKGTREELQKIPICYKQKQKQKILLITNGGKGCEVFAFGKHYFVKPTKIISSKNTIGAGDTFFAYFISCFMKNENALDSAKYAAEKTSLFLCAQNSRALDRIC